MVVGEEGEEEGDGGREGGPDHYGRGGRREDGEEGGLYML